MNTSAALHGTTILAVRKDGEAALAGDGQLSLGASILKRGARTIRKLHNGQVLGGFAGSTGDALALFATLEAKLDEHRGNLERASAELAREWRTDRVLRRLDALLIVMDRQSSFLLSCRGDVIAPDDGLLAAGAGGPFALSAARALHRHTEMHAADVAVEALKVAASVCIYTNDAIAVETL